MLKGNVSQGRCLKPRRMPAAKGSVRSPSSVSGRLSHWLGGSPSQEVQNAGPVNVKSRHSTIRRDAAKNRCRQAEGCERLSMSCAVIAESHEQKKPERHALAHFPAAFLRAGDAPSR
jgi:hypothetical protein